MFKLILTLVALSIAVQSGLKGFAFVFVICLVLALVVGALWGVIVSFATSSGGTQVPSETTSGGSASERFPAMATVADPAKVQEALDRADAWTRGQGKI